MLVENLSTTFSECYQATQSPWLQQHRVAAFDQFQASGFPTRKDEHWKYTDTSAITQSDFIIADTGSPVSHQIDLAQLRYQNLDCHKLVFIDGFYSAGQSKVGKLPDGVILKPFQAITGNQSGLAGVEFKSMC